MFEIKPAMPYPDEYEACTELAEKELESNARPALANNIDNLAQYDTIFLGYPVWWSVPPMAVSTFLEHYDFSGKKIFPFATHEGSGFGGSVSYIKKNCPKAEVMDGLAIHGAEAAQRATLVERWLKGKV